MHPDMRRAKVPVSWPLAGPYGHPYHPALVSVPIGAWIASMAFDVSSHLVSKPAFLAEGSEWLIAIGIIGAIIGAWPASWIWRRLPKAPAPTGRQPLTWS